MKKNFKFLIAVIIFLSFPAYAQLGIAGGKKDSNEPIDIESDSLVVKPEQNMAIFKGKVKAVQGNMTLLSDQMVVYYHGSEKNSDPMGSELSKIETFGNVVLTVPGKKAESDKGKYDVDNSYIMMIGNVVLTQDKNVLKGEKFLYNVATGESRIETGKEEQDKGKDQTKKPRVKGVFVPKPKAGEKDKPASKKSQ